MDKQIVKQDLELPEDHPIIELTGYRLDPSSEIRRIPTRPAAEQDGDFSSRFDYHTIIYDAVFSEDRTTVALIAPKLFNLKSLLEQSTFRALPANSPLTIDVVDLDRCSIISLDAPEGLQTIAISGPLGDYSIEPRPCLTHLLAGERVVYTAQKNNNLQWIRDWAEFYHVMHGATAFLIYDNASDVYDAEALRAAVQDIVPRAKVIVVRWPFIKGPRGKGAGRYWDSDFSQISAFAHARRLFLNAAGSVVNCDIDELVVGPAGASIFAAVERSPFGYISFSGYWMYGLNGLTRERGTRDFRFGDFVFVERSRYLLERLWFQRRRKCPPKWAVVPARCKPEAQWLVHKITGVRFQRLRSLRFSFRHYREINTAWVPGRIVRHDFDRRRFDFDVALAEAYARLGWHRAE